LTPQNIVIGGAAGAFPAPIGWAAVTGGLDLTPMLLFLVVFLWTPPHFWALSLYRAEDYARAGVPMLPVVAGPSETRRQIAGYGWAMVIASLAPVATGAVGAAYAVAAVVLGMIFMMRVEAVRTSGVGDSAADDRACRRLFKFSLLYLFLLFLSLPVDRVIGRGAW
jgi:protoheme IX farnesyltransferase